MRQFPPYRLVRSARRSLQISVEPDGVVLVRAPRRMAAGAIELFLREKEDWIRRQQSLAQERARRHPPHAFAAGESFWLLGEELFLDPGEYGCVARRGSALLVPGALEEREPRLVAWYRDQARAYLSARAAELARRHGFTHNGVRITSAKGRYGSCNRQGGLNFSWRLIMAPPATVDAVILHELCHTKEHNHSARFWRLVDQSCPDYTARCGWLRENGAALVSFGTGRPPKG